MNPIYELQQVLRYGSNKVMADNSEVIISKEKLAAIIDELLSHDLKQFITNEVKAMCNENSSLWSEMEGRISDDCCPVCNDDEPTVDDNGVSLVGSCAKCGASWSGIHRFELLSLKRK